MSERWCGVPTNDSDEVSGEPEVNPFEPGDSPAHSPIPDDTEPYEPYEPYEPDAVPAPTGPPDPTPPFIPEQMPGDRLDERDT